jgi:hypothetical protein
MKQLPIILLFFFGSTSLFAQEEKKILGHEIGLNATFLVNEILSFDGEDPAEEPFALYYKLIGNRKFAFRFGLGLQVDNRELEETDDPGTNPQNSVKLSSANLRFGVEFQESLSERWLFYAGADAVVQSSQSVVDNIDPFFGDSKVTQSSALLGGGPVLGIQFRINERVRLSTESSLYFLAGKEKQKVEFDNPGFPTDPIEETSKLEKLDIRLPVSLYFSVIL